MVRKGGWCTERSRDAGHDDRTGKVEAEDETGNREKIAVGGR
jgi:hypothetical protein